LLPKIYSCIFSLEHLFASIYRSWVPFGVLDASRTFMAKYSGRSCSPMPQSGNSPRNPEILQRSQTLQRREPNPHLTKPKENQPISRFSFSAPVLFREIYSALFSRPIDFRHSLQPFSCISTAVDLVCIKCLSRFNPDWVSASIRVVPLGILSVSSCSVQLCQPYPCQYAEPSAHLPCVYSWCRPPQTNPPHPCTFKSASRQSPRQH
jgi:hypothetical protein